MTIYSKFLEYVRLLISRVKVVDFVFPSVHLIDIDDLRQIYIYAEPKISFHFQRIGGEENLAFWCVIEFHKSNGHHCMLDS